MMPSVTTFWTMPLMSALPSLAFVWPSNCGSVSFTLMTAVRPSRTSSPERLASFSLSVPDLRAQVLSELVSAARKPATWVPPSTVWMLFANGEHVLGEAVVVLERDLDARRAHHALDVDRPPVEHVAPAVQVPHEAEVTPPWK